MKTRLLRGTTAQNNALVLPEGMLSIDSEKKALRIHDGVTPGGYEAVGVRAYHPPVGPGPTDLIAGTSEAGFFGEVGPEELITGAELAALIGLSAGTDINSDAPWLKFAHQGKILFVAKKCFRHTVNWAHLNQLGAAYGELEVEIGGDRFKVRLLTGSDSDPTSGPGGEWNALLYPVHIDGPVEEHWAAYTNEDLWVGAVSSYGVSSWCQEQGSNTSQRVARGWHSIEYYNTMTYVYGANARDGWRPVLELIEG